MPRGGSDSSSDDDQNDRRTVKRGFVPRSKRQQLAAIGLNHNACAVRDTEVYDKVPKRRLQEFWESLRTCIDPSGGDWEDIEPPERDEWLDGMLHKTPDQSFREYVASRPNRPDKSRNVLYLVPLCDPNDLEAPAFPSGPWPSWRVLEAAAERFFAPLHVKTLPAVPMHQLSPRPASRMGSWGVEQWHAGTALTAWEKRVPRDAYGLMAVTMCDLYPKPEWNFVYGLARLTQRVGIFSFVRHTPGKAPDAWRGAHLLHRSLKTLLHEIGHMFGLKHCTWYNCLMRGSNGEQVEHQRNHLHLCPVCLRKLHWNIGFDIRDRYTGLLGIYQAYAGAHEDFAKECAFLHERVAKLEALPQGSTMTSEVSSSSLQALAAVKQSNGTAPGAKVEGASRLRATSTPSVRQNGSRRGSPPIFAQNAVRVLTPPECPCCDNRLESTVGQRRNFDADRASKLLEDLGSALCAAGKNLDTAKPSPQSTHRRRRREVVDGVTKFA